MRNIIVFGNVPLATWVINTIRNHKNFNLIGVVCDNYPEDAFLNHGMDEKSAYSYCIKNNVNVLGFEEAFELAKKNSILGVSVRYHRLFKEEYYSVFKPGIINLHGGELPRYRGANIANYAIYEGAKQLGGTLHFISKGIDEGDIVERVITPVQEKLTAYEYFTFTLNALKVAFERFLNRTDVQDDESNIFATPQTKLVEAGEISKLYYKNGIEAKREIQFDEIGSWDDLYRMARAFTFPGHRGLILQNGDEKIELKVIKND